MVGWNDAIFVTHNLWYEHFSYIAVKRTVPFFFLCQLS